LNEADVSKRSALRSHGLNYSPYPDYNQINPHQIVQYSGKNHHNNAEDKGYYPDYQTAYGVYSDAKHNTLPPFQNNQHPAGRIKLCIQPNRNIVTYL
jgi:hypothetical protein